MGRSIYFPVNKMHHQNLIMTKHLPSIGFASNVYFAILEIKSIHEVLPEPEKLRRHILLIRSCGCALTKSSSHRLLNPDNIGQVGPSPCVLDRFIGSILPLEGAILLQEAFKG
jgi:hypothetical protein